MICLLEHCRAREEWLIATIEDLARNESPSVDKGAADRCGRQLVAHLRSLGAHVDIVAQETVGDIVMADFGAGSRQVLLLGHYDTVWPVGTLARMPVDRSDGRLFGPGVLDMKAGLGIAMLAACAVVQCGAASGTRLRLLITSDEEIGSDASRALVEREARESIAVLVLEPSLSGGGLKTSRKGVGEFVIEVAGVAAHAGVDPGAGASAITELAHQILSVQRLADPSRGTTVNVGVIDGGTRANVVAERARAIVDVRVTTAAEAERMSRALAELAAFVPGTSVTVSGGLNRPPMERGPHIAELFATALEAASELGLTLTEGSTGGASDGNFTAALGVPTLDGIGAVGEGPHARHEHVILDALVPRAALVAGVIARVVGASAEGPDGP
ncbi:MAG: M20/M25/M40 family metallo-hydrolase [Luteitalea sp.]|nr:M20/M25/M40 family metallo-hydrolase [Luteitalea sp.]